MYACVIGSQSQRLLLGIALRGPLGAILYLSCRLLIMARNACGKS
jgi:hypothetical protein